jgi:hypothetical protein
MRVRDIARAHASLMFRESGLGTMIDSSQCATTRPLHRTRHTARHDAGLIVTTQTDSRCRSGYPRDDIRPPLCVHTAESTAQVHAEAS